MNKQDFYLLNTLGKRISISIEGEEKSSTNIVFVHGFGTNRNEGENFFYDVADVLGKKFRLIRFDFSGYGQSDGAQEDVSLTNQMDDLRTVLIWAEKDKKREIVILAHSLGCFVVSMLSPEGIKKSIFSSTLNSNSKDVVRLFKKRIESKGGIFDKNNVSTYCRSSGEIQRIGNFFWSDLENLNIIKITGEYAQKTKLLIIHPNQDEIAGNSYFNDYKHIANAKYMNIPGSHNYSKKEDRGNAIKIINNFIEND